MAARIRQSNMELLRIVSMIMVVLVHVDGASLGLPAPGGDLLGLGARDVWRLAVESAAIIGVNCFTMISGYFGIRLRLRSVCSYLFECAFYSVGIFTLVWIAFPTRFSAVEWLESWLVLTHTDLWYVPAYFGLMILSPLLNAGFDALSRRMASAVLLAFIVFNVWCGRGWGAQFNPSGYTLVQLIMVYLMGRYVALHGLPVGRRGAAVLYLVSVAAVFVSAVYMEPIRAFAYNSPAVLAATVGCFLWFGSLHFQSRAVNYIARSSFAVYLIHKSPLVWGNVMKPVVMKLWATQSLGAFSLCAIGVVAVWFAVAMCADAVRRAVWRRLESLQTATQKEVAG